MALLLWALDEHIHSWEVAVGTGDNRLMLFGTLG